MGLKYYDKERRIGSQTSWRRDPTILANIEKAQKLKAMRHSNAEIARMLKVHHTTVASWLTWGLQLYSEKVVLNHHELVLDSVASFDLLIAEGWKHLAPMAKTPGKNPSGAAALIGQLQNAEWKRAQLWNLVQDAAQARIQGMTEDEIRNQLERVAVRLGLRLAPLGSFGTSEALGAGVGQPVEAEFFDPDGDSGITTGDVPEATELHEVLPDDVPGGSETLALEAPALHR